MVYVSPSCGEGSKSVTCGEAPSDLLLLLQLQYELTSGDWGCLVWVKWLRAFFGLARKGVAAYPLFKVTSPLLSILAF